MLTANRPQLIIRSLLLTVLHALATKQCMLHNAGIRECNACQS